LHVLDTGLSLFSVKEEQDGKHGGQARREKLDVGSLGQTEQIQEVSSAEETELIAESSLDAAIRVSSTVQLSTSGSDLIMIVDQ